MPTSSESENRPEQPDPAGDTAETAPKRRRWRRTRITLAVLAAAVVVTAFAVRSPSPVGHWDGAEGQDRFLAAYDEAFADLPTPEQTLDVRTDYGVVRVYRFAGSGDAASPLVLLPVGGEIGDEVHEETDQLLVFVSGTGAADVGGQTHPVDPGDMWTVPAGERHNFRNTGDEPLVLYTSTLLQSMRSTLSTPRRRKPTRPRASGEDAPPQR